MPVSDDVEIGAQRDPDFIRRAIPVLETYVRWFRPEVRGFDRLPPEGPFLVVGNHSGGTTTPDLPILMTRWWRERGVDEPVYGLFHSAFLGLPGIGTTVQRAGALEAGWDNAEAILRRGGIVIVYPGGDHEALRPLRDRDRIDFAGRTGFLELALRTGVPIVPVVSCGAHDTVLVLSRGERLAARMPLARQLRVKAMPVTIGLPWGVAIGGLPTVPLPAKVVVELCPPIDVSAEFGGPTTVDDADRLQSAYDRVTGTMQDVLDRLAAERPGQRWVE
ncbi:MAG: lysophospholipid acyltransferase family protein [Acidimicrobiales bacterium]